MQMPEGSRPSAIQCCFARTYGSQLSISPKRVYLFAVARRPVLPPASDGGIVDADPAGIAEVNRSTFQPTPVRRPPSEIEDRRAGLQPYESRHRSWRWRHPGLRTLQAVPPALPSNPPIERPPRGRLLKPRPWEGWQPGRPRRSRSSKDHTHIPQRGRRARKLTGDFSSGGSYTVGEVDEGVGRDPAFLVSNGHPFHGGVGVANGFASTRGPWRFGPGSPGPRHPWDRDEAPPANGSPLPPIARVPRG